MTATRAPSSTQQCDVRVLGDRGFGALWFRVWGLGFRLRVSGFGFRVSGFGLSEIGFGGFVVQGFGFRVLGFGCFSCLGCRLTYRVWGLYGSAFRVLGLKASEVCDLEV